jgi:bidirectional [NiFe] hydrogenase diaphorase subunit
VKNAAELVTAVRKEYGIEPGQMTADHLISLNTARCLGSCGLAPVVLLDGEVVGRALPETLLAQIRAALATARVREPACESESTAQVLALQSEEPA